jgi:hypothetical protein
MNIALWLWLWVRLVNIDIIEVAPSELIKVMISKGKEGGVGDGCAHQRCWIKHGAVQARRMETSISWVDVC